MLRRGVVLGSLVFGLLASGALAQPLPLTILHTNDTHDHLLPYDTRAAKDLGGIARRATLIAQLKRQLPSVLVLDAGDTFQGTPLFTFFNGAADYDALDAAGYDATTVGNHDLDNGLDNLKQQAKNRHFKVISTNLLDEKTGKPIFVGTHVFERGGVKVGVFGVLGDNALLAVAEKNQKGFKFVSPYKMAEQVASDLRKQCDLVVMLSHSGLDEDCDLASKVRGIDVIVGGHSHSKLEHPREIMDGDWKTLVVQGFQWGEYVGRLDLMVEGSKILSYDGKLLPVTNAIADDATVAATVNKYNDKIAERMAVVLGKAPKGLSTAGKYAHDCELGNWTADLLCKRGEAEIGIMNAGGLRAELAAGDVKVGDVFTIFPFDNAVVTLDMPGSALQHVVDRAAATPAKNGMLQYAGLTFRVDGNKALDVMVNGKPLDPARTYKVSTIDYIAQGNDGMVEFTQGTHMHALGLLLRDAVIEEVKAVKTVTTPATGRIRVAGGCVTDGAGN